MAKKEENKLSYLQSYVPNASSRAYRTAKRNFTGYNKRQTVDTGMLSLERNISTDEAPYLVPSKKTIKLWDYYGGDTLRRNFVGKFYPNPLYIYAEDTKLIVLYTRKTNALSSRTLAEVTYVDFPSQYTGFYREIPGTNNTGPTSIIPFTYYKDGEYLNKKDKKTNYLIFPDKYSFDSAVNGSSEHGSVPEIYGDNGINIGQDDLNKYNKCFSFRTLYGRSDDYPDIKYATTSMSRLFGLCDGLVVASNFNSTAVTLDTSSSYSASNGWVSASPKGKYTGIKSFMGHVICFGKNFMQEIYNNKNPFRIRDIYPEGAIDSRTIQEVNGKLIFVSEDGVKIYTGSDPAIISYQLNIDRFKYAVSGTDGVRYYLYVADDENGTNDCIYVYNTLTGAWSEQEFKYCKDNDDEYGHHIINFAYSDNLGLLALVGYQHNEKTGSDGYKYSYSGRIIKFTDDYADNWSFETDLMTSQTVDIKHLRKVQMLADIGEGARLKIYALYGDEKFDKDKSQLLYDSNNKSGKQTIRVKPRKTASYGFKLHIEGQKYVKLYEMEIITEPGGEQYV